MTDDDQEKEQKVKRTTVIDNESMSLMEVLQTLLPKATSASIAVGYFYISGFAPIMNSLETIEKSDKNDGVLRLLISPSTDKPTAEAMLAGNEALEKVQAGTIISHDDLKKAVKEQTEKALAHMPQNDDDLGTIRKFITLIRDDKIQIRVYTKTQLHAKLYILKSNETPITSIIGSSNLSIQGIRDHAELNLKTPVIEYGDKLQEWFDKHWKESVPFTEDMLDTMENSWAGKLCTPGDVYDKAALEVHGDVSTVSVPGSTKATLYDFQKRAVESAINKLEKYGGVMVADVVGTGKSYIGGMLMRHIYDNNGRHPLVICPPHLIDTWQDHMMDFGLMSGNVVSRHRIGDNESNDIVAKYGHCDTILVDESHNFRNTSTDSYAALAKFLENKADDVKIILLTATPISNGITDLKNQLKLFPDTIQDIPVLGRTGLDEYFKGLEKDHVLSTQSKEKVQELLRHVLIRRTRTQILLKYGKPGKDGRRYITKDGKEEYFPARDLKNPPEYDVNKVYNRGENGFEKILESIKELKLARYNPGEYLKTDYEEDGKYSHVEPYKKLRTNSQYMVGIVRTTLLKRMESSIAAFASSVDRYRNGSEAFMELLKDDMIPIGKKFSDHIHKKISDDKDNDEFEEDLFDDIPERDRYKSESFDINRWKLDLIHDIGKFDSMKILIPEEKEFYECDDKAKKLCGLVTKFAGEKILVFTESAVTAKHIHEYLVKYFEKDPSKKAPNMAQIDSTTDRSTKKSVVYRFAPEYNTGKEISKEEELDVLISTDILSEGVNLQSCGIVINYDFHWNPVKLIQRVGRIDRIGTTHDTILIRNFLPSEMIDEELELKDRVSKKIRIIRDIIGLDQKILQTTELIDEDSVKAIYAGEEGILDGGGGSVLDTNTKSDDDAEGILADDTVRNRVENLPQGLRAVAAPGDLLIACEAVGVIRDKATGDTINSRRFRKYYCVKSDGMVESIMSSKMLARMRECRNMGGSADDAVYNRLVKKAWERFNRDMRDSDARYTRRKIQEYFIKTLAEISRENPDLGRDTFDIQAWLENTEMRSDRQPCRALISMKRDIDEGRVMEPRSILEKIKTIQEKYRNHGCEKRTGRPRIMHSMMVGT